MEITEVRIMNMKNDKLRAFASVTFDGCFVVHDIKIINAPKGLLVCMPSKRPQVECPECGQKISAGSAFCPLCGERVPLAIGTYDARKDRKDIAHPINEAFRKTVSQAVLSAFEKQSSIF